MYKYLYDNICLLQWLWISEIAIMLDKNSSDINHIYYASGLTTLDLSQAQPQPAQAKANDR